MAPRRKRTTAKKGRTTRAKPKLPEGKLESSMTEEEKENKMTAYINDYNLQVKAKLDKMRKSISTVKSLLANVCRNALIQLPKNVKQMTMKEFMSRGGTVNAAINAQVTESISALVSSSIPLDNTSNNRLPLGNVSNKVDDSALHVDEAAKTETTSNVKTAGKQGRQKKFTELPNHVLFSINCALRHGVAVRITDDRPAVATATRSSRRLQAKISGLTNGVTPMPTINSQSVLQTPFITPKFDPRLPFTPAILREPKAGERIVSMCGSPLTNPAGPDADTAPQVFIPLKGGKTMQLSVNDRSVPMEVDVTNDNVAMQNIKLLQEKLSMLLQIPANIQ